MQRRRKAREAALQVLYGLDITGDGVDEAMDLFWDMETESQGEEEEPRIRGTPLYPTIG